MKRTMLICLALVLGGAVLFADSVWEGSATMSAYGDFPATGYYGASNSFPRNTLVEVENLENSTKTTVIIVDRLDDPGFFILLSAEAARDLGISQQNVVRVRVSQADIKDTILPSPVEESALSRDPDINPAAEMIVEAEEDDSEDAGEMAEVVEEPVIEETVAEQVVEPSEESVGEEDSAAEIAAEQEELPQVVELTAEPSPVSDTTLSLDLPEADATVPVATDSLPSADPEEALNEVSTPDLELPAEPQVVSAESENPEVSTLSAAPQQEEEPLFAESLSVEVPEPAHEEALLPDPVEDDIIVAAETEVLQPRVADMVRLVRPVDPGQEPAPGIADIPSPFEESMVADAEVVTGPVSLNVPMLKVPEETLNGFKLDIPEYVVPVPLHLNGMETAFVDESPVMTAELDLPMEFPEAEAAVESEPEGPATISITGIAAVEPEAEIPLPETDVLPADPGSESEPEPEIVIAEIPEPVVTEEPEPEAETEISVVETAAEIEVTAIAEEPEPEAETEISVVETEAEIEVTAIAEEPEPEAETGISVVETEDTGESPAANVVKYVIERAELRPAPFDPLAIIEAAPAPVEPEEKATVAETTSQPPEPQESQREPEQNTSQNSSVPVKTVYDPKVAPVSFPVVDKLEKELYYLQVGVFRESSAVETLVDSLDDFFPTTVFRDPVETEAKYKVLVGPVHRDESGIVLYNLKAKGYTDAYIRKAD